MSDVYKATNKKVKNNNLQNDVYKATTKAQVTDETAYKKTLSEQIQKGIASEINYKFTPAIGASVEADIKRDLLKGKMVREIGSSITQKIGDSVPTFPKGSLTPDSIKNAIAKDLRAKEENRKARTTIPSLAYDPDEVELEAIRERKSKQYTEMEVARKKWEDWENSDGTALSKALDYIGSSEVNDLRRDYEDKKAAYESVNEEYNLKNQELTEKRIQKTYGVTGAEYISQLKEKKNAAETDSEKEYYKKEIEKVRQNLYGESNVFTHFGNIVKEGLLQANKGVMASVDFLLGTPAKWLGFEDNVFTKANREATQWLEEASTETHKSSQYLGDTDNLSGEFGTALVAAIPDMLLTMYTGGASAGTQLGSKAIAAANPTLVSKITNDVIKTAKSPIFYTSFIRELGVNYEENLESGNANEAESALAAILASIISARMEMGGFQELPDELAETKGFWKKAYKWALSSFEEGLEEPAQTSATNLVNKIIYDHDKKWVSTTDDGAVFNLKRAAKEFAIGTFVGAALGGGQLTFRGIVNARSNSQYKQIGKAALKVTNIQEIIDYAKSAPNDSIRTIAREVNAKNITDADAGRVYQYVVRNVGEKFDDVYTVEELNAVVSEYFLGNTPKAIKDIASATFANKLVEMNIEPESNEVYKDLTSSTEIEGEDNGSTVVDATQESRLGVATNTTENTNKKIISTKATNKQRRHTTAKEQDFIKNIAKALGVKLEFTDITAEHLRSMGYMFNDGDILPDGYYDRESGIVHIGYSVYNPVAFILKHELTHFGEGTEQYNKFVNAVKKSKAFKDWLQKNIGFNNKVDPEEAYLLRIARERGYTIGKYSMLSEEDRIELHCEMIADFVGECIFTDDTSMLQNMLSDLNYKERNSVVQYILDFLSYLKKKLAGNKDIMFEISRLEDSFNRMLSEAVDINKETPTENGGELQFSYGVTQSDIDNYVDAAYKKENVEDYKKYAVPSQRLISDVAEDIDITGYSHALRDNDIRHIKNSHGENTNEKYPVTSEDIKQIPWIVENYDKVFAKTNSQGKPGVVYVKVADENVIYYVEAVTEEYHKEKLLVNKQMVKTGIDEIPNLYGLINAINKKESSSQYLADLQEIREAYVQDVKENYSNNSISGNQPSVNNNSKKDLQFSFARVQDGELINELEAKEKRMRDSGYTENYIRQNIWNWYGVIRDAAGEWVYEIPDRVMKFFPFGDAKRKNLSELKKEDLLFRKGKLGDFVKHPELFKRFPQLKDVNFEINKIEQNALGKYTHHSNTITISSDAVIEAYEKSLELNGQRVSNPKNDPFLAIKQLIVHEMQHVIQKLEDRERGSSIEYWNMRFKREGALPINPSSGAMFTPEGAYWFSKGEYEAREVMERVATSSNYRKHIMPDLGWGRTISAKESSVIKSERSTVSNDDAYMSAVESGDMKQLQKMVDNTAISNGYTERLYHQTGAEFTEFNTDNEIAGKYDWELPTGIFLKPSDEDIGLKGKKQMELFAKVNNPLEFKDRAEARAYWIKNIEGYRQAVKAVEKIDNEYREKDDDAIMELQSYMRQWRRENTSADKHDIFNDPTYQRLADKEAAIMEEWEQKSDKASIKAKKLINNFMAKSHYDGIVIENDQGAGNRRTKSYIVFDSAQLKSAAPITYDNTGAVISLSQRFDPIKKDIRFSMPRETFDLLDSFEKGEITKAEYQEAMNRYWDDVIAEVQDAAWAQQLELIKSNAKLRGRIKRQNEQLARRRSEISEEITAQREERATKQKNIEHIRKTVGRIDKMLRTNSESKHVPEDLKEVITKFISIFVANDRSPFDKKDLRLIYLTYSDALRESSVEETSGSLDEDVLRDLKHLQERLDGKTLRQLTYFDTIIIRNIIDNFAQIIKWENEMFIAGKDIKYHEAGKQALNELTAKKSKRENVVTKAVDTAVVYSNMTPIYFFDKIGGIFKTLFNDVVEAQNKWFRNVENGKTFIRQIKEKYHYSEWADDTFKFTTEKGDEIEITREQAMLLYATAKREYGNDFQKAEHLFRGGVVIEPNAKKLKEVVKKFKGSDEKGRKRIAEAFSEEVDSRAHRITPDDVLKIKFWLTDEQLAYVDAFVEYLSTDMAALGNEVSMQLYGIRKYNEEYYIPYNSAQNFLYSQPGVTNEVRLKHQSFTKNTVVGANNPLVLSDFSTVCADHINRMCMYNALTMPLENMNKIFNYKNTPKGDVDARSVQSELERAYGKNAVTYIKTFIEDMNGNVRVSNTDKAINRWISKFKKGAVFASASVVVQQPSAIIRAMAYIKPKYFAKTTLKLSERDYQECVRYAPVAGIKEMGRFDTGVGAATTNWLLQETPYGFKNKVKALFSKDSTYRDDKMSYFAAKADEITWAHIWAAVKAEIADTTNLKVGSREYFEACGKRFTDVINYTQVYDSTISRSQMMRSKSTGAQMLTAFMSEPTVSLNLLMNAADRAKNGGKEGKHFAAGAVAAFVGSVALNSILKSLVTAARDDDEEKTYFEKYGDELLGNFTSDINPLGLIPFVRDVLSVFEGYTVERADMNLFSDLAQSISYLGSDKKTGYEKFESVLGSLAAFLGLPVKNVLRDGRAVYNLCNNLFVTDKKNRAVNSEVEGYFDEYSEKETYEALAEEDKEKLEKDITKTVREVNAAEGDKQKRDKFDELYAEKRKSQKAYNEMRKKMLEEGYTEDEITDGVEIARIAYMKSQGIDVGDYLLYKIATSKKYADTDKSGGVSKKEKEAAVREMDIDEKIKKYFLEQHK